MWRLHIHRFPNHMEFAHRHGIEVIRQVVLVGGLLRSGGIDKGGHHIRRLSVRPARNGTVMVIRELGKHNQHFQRAVGCNILPIPRWIAAVRLGGDRIGISQRRSAAYHRRILRECLHGV